MKCSFKSDWSMAVACRKIVSERCYHFFFRFNYKSNLNLLMLPPFAFFTWRICILTNSSHTWKFCLYIQMLFTWNQTQTYILKYKLRNGLFLVRFAKYKSITWLKCYFTLLKTYFEIMLLTCITFNTFTAKFSTAKIDYK